MDSQFSRTFENIGKRQFWCKRGQKGTAQERGSPVLAFCDALTAGEGAVGGGSRTALVAGDGAPAGTSGASQAICRSHSISRGLSCISGRRSVIRT